MYILYILYIEYTINVFIKVCGALLILKGFKVVHRPDPGEYQCHISFTSLT